jgi:hypothetical protein
MKRGLYILLAIVGYILLSSKSCSEGKENNAISQEESLIQEKINVKNEFASEFLSGKSILAFESKAKQKLTDLSDYLNILSDSSMDHSFKDQSKQMVLNLFISDTTVISNLVINDADSRKETVKKFAETIRFRDNNKIMIDSIRVIEQLHVTSDKNYKGRLAFSRRLMSRLAKDSVSMHSVPLQAEFFVSKIKKSFGTDTIQVWNLSFGTIY